MPELTLLYPPEVGTVLPLVPLTVEELQAALALPEPESSTARERSELRTKCLPLIALDAGGLQAHTSSC